MSTKRDWTAVAWKKARPTWYAGTLMRSRLEASFAQSLDREGLASFWEYEPCCFASPDGQYLPDFRVWWGKQDYEYVEIKPTVQVGLAAAKRMEIIFATEPHACLSIRVPKPGPLPVEFQAVAIRWGSVENALVSGQWRYPLGAA